MNSFTPSGIITITTDFGHRGPFVGVMKGVILKRFPEAKLVDLTNETYVHWPAEAGFWLEKSFPYFPKGTVHLAVVDPGVGTDRSLLVVEGMGHVFVAPDNGLLANVIERTSGIPYIADANVLQNLGIVAKSATFHGRDLFAPLAAELSSGENSSIRLLNPTDEYVPSLIEPAELRSKEIRGIIITTDHFGNLITNIENNLVKQLSKPTVEVSGRYIPLLRTYADASPGDYLALINSFDVLEIARAEQNASESLGLGRGSPVVVRSR